MREPRELPHRRRCQRLAATLINRMPHGRHVQRNSLRPCLTLTRRDRRHVPRSIGHTLLQVVRGREVAAGGRLSTFGSGSVEIG